MKNKIIIHTDGGARGNPGPAAIGVVIEGMIEKAASPKAGEPRLVFSRREYGEYLGEATNNDAEYRAVILALKKLKHLIGGEKAKNSRVEIHVDSELLERQLNGEYKIKDETIKDLFIEIWNLTTDFGQVVFKHIPRKENAAGDMI